ncbi:sugar kinase [Streptomyces sp. WM6373]|uniref:sugar kinase n=1 Tax=Streptomyces TaxID=1883 RepID=UPI0006AE6878|nr:MULTISPECIES: sugar kinase [unclassified Streptomyces]KOU34382.1 sugar kinase [Streptomyces sp. WM6373]KOU61371.1 sugar kinase [Streptomyces sp. IGB124]KOU77353.1 sugar kinase [Streptomyces sp. XY66]KOV17199.1 sugar kinase [Streptomyces sp. XY413]KOV31618.1 sugar kinase [Streptomyces sp. H021]
MTALVTLGEAMAVLAAERPGPLAPGSSLRLGFAGAEATVAIGVSRLGHAASWTGRVGADSAGTMILDGLRGESVDVTRARVDDAAPTGLMLRERRTPDHTRVTYYRRGLAGSRLTPADVDPELVTRARVLHVTGITPALGDGPRAAVRRAVDLARAAGVTVSLDLNYRARLWTREEAAAELTHLVTRADIVFAGPDEASLVVPEAEPATMARTLLDLGPREAVLKLGARGAVAVTRSARAVQDIVPVTAVDPIGAGDAFVAGYLAGLLDDAPLPGRLLLAATCGAFAVAVSGDWEGLPRRSELDLLLGADVTR